MRTGSRTSVDIDTQESFERVWNRTQIVLYIVVTGVILAALLGLFGGGWLASVETPLPGGSSSVAYERFQRNKAETRITLRLGAAPASGNLELRLSPSIMEAFKIADTVPRATAMRSGPGGVVMSFALESGGPTAVALQIEPVRFGIVRGWIECLGARVPTFQLIYP
jgi:hypothetical protein